MKRSEAIRIIKDNLSGYTPDDEKCANWILEDLEKVGMLPPQRNADQKSSYGYAQIWEWEKENE